MPPRKRPYHHGDLSRTLLDASVELIVERGLDALSLREVARRAGVSPAAPYHHFASREELLVALALEGFTMLALAMQTARDAATGASAIERLGAIGEAYVRFAVAHPAHFRLMFRPSLVSPGALPEEGAPGQAFALLVDGVSDVLESEGVRERVDRRGLVLVAWSLVHGAAELLLDGPLANGLPELSIRASEVPALLNRSFEGILSALSGRPPPARRRKA
jgi:AcrR family transcriptional regulator